MADFAAQLQFYAVYPDGLWVPFQVQRTDAAGNVVKDEDGDPVEDFKQAKFDLFLVDTLCGVFYSPTDSEAVITRRKKALSEAFGIPADEFTRAGGLHVPDDLQSIEKGSAYREWWLNELGGELDSSHIGIGNAGTVT